MKIIRLYPINLAIQLGLSFIVGNCLYSMQSPFIAYVICGVCIAVAFPWIEVVNKDKGDDNGPDET